MKENEGKPEDPPATSAGRDPPGRPLADLRADIGDASRKAEEYREHMAKLFETLERRKAPIESYDERIEKLVETLSRQRKGRVGKVPVSIVPRAAPTVPGLILGGLVRRLMDPEAYSRFLEPQVADMQMEYLECRRKGNRVAALCAVVRGQLLAVRACVWVFMHRARR